MLPNLPRIVVVSLGLLPAIGLSRLNGQSPREAELQEKIRKLEGELADARRRLQDKEFDIQAALDRDYQELLNKDRQATFLRQAAQHFAEKGGGWGYRSAHEILRKHRSQAAVPLILKYMISQNVANR